MDSRDYYLVHAFPANTREDELWARPQLDSPNPYPGFQVIVGHTPTIYFGRTDAEADRMEEELFRQGKHMEICHSSSFIGIDCGCGTADRVGALACLRLEDMSEFYVTKEEIKDPLSLSDLTDDEKIDITARHILKRFKPAFEELAK